MMQVLKTKDRQPHIHTFIRNCTHTYIHTEVHTHTSIHMEVHTHTYIHTEVHTHTHTHIHSYGGGAHSIKRAFYYSDLHPKQLRMWGSMPVASLGYFLIFVGMEKFKIIFQ